VRASEVIANLARCLGKEIEDLAGSNRITLETIQGLTKLLEKLVIASKEMEIFEITTSCERRALLDKDPLHGKMAPAMKTRA
jgi:hypothetical protein